MEVRWLKCRHYSIQKKYKATKSTKHPAHTITQPKPHEVATTNFTQTSYEEEKQRYGDSFSLVTFCHNLLPTIRRPVLKSVCFMTISRGWDDQPPSNNFSISSLASNNIFFEYI